jgi:hypothetical protein
MDWAMLDNASAVYAGPISPHHLDILLLVNIERLYGSEAVADVLCSKFLVRVAFASA